MSRTKRYPELLKADLRNGVSYACAYLRLGLGWPLARAVSEPPRKRKPRLASARLIQDYIDEECARTARVMTHKRFTTPSVVHRRVTEDKSPTRIRRIREAYCDHFIKTGILDESMAAQLRTYADDKRASLTDPQRVPSQHASRHYRGARKGDGDHGSRPDVQTDIGTAKLISAFLRSR